MVVGIFCGFFDPIKIFVRTLKLIRKKQQTQPSINHLKIMLIKTRGTSENVPPVFLSSKAELICFNREVSYRVGIIKLIEWPGSDDKVFS